jgi:alpha-ketoglutarate-dependent taurine dioxygenase
MKVTKNIDSYNFGAKIEGLDLSKELSEEQINEIRQTWIENQVVFFPNQKLQTKILLDLLGILEITVKIPI